MTPTKDLFFLACDWWLYSPNRIACHFPLPEASLTALGRSAIIPPEQPWRVKHALTGFSRRMHHGWHQQNREQVQRRRRVARPAVQDPAPRPLWLQRLQDGRGHAFLSRPAWLPDHRYARFRACAAGWCQAIRRHISLGYFTTHGTDH